MCTSLQRISTSPKFVKCFVTCCCSRRGTVSTSSHPPLWRTIPPLLGCSLLLIQCIHSYLPYLEAVSSICNVRTRSIAVSEIHLTRCITGITIIILVITCMQGTYNCIPETNYVSTVYSVAALLYLQSVLHEILFRP